jgi:hypothetical protein
MRRPKMPPAVRIAVVFKNMQRNSGRLICEETGHVFSIDDILGGRLHIDHNPALALRDRDSEGGYIPDANDTGFLEVCNAVGHIYRTSKRKGLFRGDQTEIAHSRKVRLKNAEFAARMREKAGGEPAPVKPLTQLQRKAAWAKKIKSNTTTSS